MDEEESQRLWEIANELDTLIPRDGATVRMEQWGGGVDESRMIGTENGYLRLGVELIAAVAQRQRGTIEDPNYLDVDWEYLEDGKGDFFFSSYKVREFLADRNGGAVAEPTPLETFKDKAIGFLLGAFVIFLVIALLVGIGTIVFWILWILGFNH